MAGNFNDQMSEMEDDRLSDISMATTCFSGHVDNPHINELRAMRKYCSTLRRRMADERKIMKGLSPEDHEDMEPDCDLTRATFGKSVVEYIEAARSKVTDCLVSELTLQMVATSVEPMRKSWEKTSYYGAFQANYVFMTFEEITAPVIPLIPNSKRTAKDISIMTDNHLATPAHNRQRTSSSKDAASPALHEDVFHRLEVALRQCLPNMTPKTEVMVGADAKNA